MSCVAIIPARGGSRRITHKNIRMFHGKPIIAYSIETALAAGIFDRVIVSTDDGSIAEIALQYGADVRLRNSAFARDAVGTQEVMRYVINQLQDNSIEYVCCLYPTAPMLRPETIRRALSLLSSNQGISYVVPVAAWLRDPGQFYFGRVNAYCAGLDLIGDGTRLLPIDPATECDINTESDWLRAEQMYLNLKGRL